LKRNSERPSATRGRNAASRAAAHAGDLKQDLELLQRLADPEATDSNAATILKTATGDRDFLIVDQILNQYPKVKMEDALTVAAEKGDLELVNIFLQRSLASDGLHTKISCGPALRAAIRKGHLQAFELLRKKSADLETDSDLRQTLVVIAASEANVKAIKRLLDLGFGHNGKQLNAGGMRALRLGVLEDNNKIINLLVETGTVSHEDLERQSDPVMVICANRNDIRLAKKLANRGADINATGRNVVTALMTAANRGYTEIAKLLLMRGAHQQSDTADKLNFPAFARVTNGLSMAVWHVADWKPQTGSRENYQTLA
jgi:ankyrin-1